MASTPSLPTSYGYTSTPLGRVLVVTSDTELVGLYFDGHARTPSTGDLPNRDSAPLEAVRRELDEYFAGTRTSFEIPLRLGGTEFQREVWSALIGIPHGTTATYRELAQRIGRPEAVRAVGAANARNPISIIVPCHRLVGSDGGLTGYGWGVDRKAWLIDHERRGTGVQGTAA
jgi:methylated-DNA-[protein]-cysteine S-methyltransferase